MRSTEVTDTAEPASDEQAVLERAIALALRAHAGHVDRAGKPYILHPLRVMLRFEEPLAMIAAVLHDVVEDSDITLEDLRTARFPEEVVSAVDALTRRPNETYDVYIRRAAENPLARQVKIADLEDNLGRTARLPASPERDARLTRYRDALAVLR